jgi:hypothetical protein
VYREALDEGDKKGRRLQAKKHPIEEIAEVTGLTKSAIKKLQNKPRK